jgi:voltage-gated potassium channel
MSQNLYQKNPFIKLYRALTLLVFNLLVGVLGFMQIEKYNFLDALYMTIISMSTVGYGIDSKSEFSANGKIFVIFFLILSAGAFVFAVTAITTFVVEGELRAMMDKFRFSRKIAKLENHIIICGLGRTGRECAAELIRQGQAFVAIEKEEKFAEEFSTYYNTLLIVGDATEEETLIKANIQKAKGVISALPADAENVFIALTARVLNPKLEIIARAEHEYNVQKLIRAGADHVILPNKIGGKRMVNLITRPGLVEFVELITGESNPDFHLEAYECAKYPQLMNKSLAELQIRSKTGLLVIGCKHLEENTDLNPDPSMVIRNGDRLFLLGNRKSFDLFWKLYLNV